MNVLELMQGSSTHAVTGHVLSTVANRLAFKLGWAAFVVNSKEQEGLPEQRRSAEMAEALGQNGLPQGVGRLDLDEIVEGYAAATILVYRYMRTPDPESGKYATWMEKSCPDPKFLIAKQLHWFLSNPDPQIQAEAKMLGADPSKRLAAIAAERNDVANTQSLRVAQTYYNHLKRMEQAENDILCQIALDAMTNANYNPLAEVIKGAEFQIERARERFNEGKYVNIDPGIYTLVQGKIESGTVNSGIKLFKPERKPAFVLDTRNYGWRAKLVKMITG